MKVILFDADGVLTLPEELFTQMYAKSRGLDPEPFEQFFRDEWNDLRIGKKDLKESISVNPDLWQWNGTVDELVEYWCKTEDVRNDDLIDVIKLLKEKGIPTCLATDQERYRGQYMKNIMFAGLFDNYYISSDIGCSKTNPEFFEFIIKDLQKDKPDLLPKDVIFFDDSQSKVDTAKTCGLDARLYTSINQVTSLLK